jgi:hypothetical protein
MPDTSVKEDPATAAVWTPESSTSAGFCCTSQLGGIPLDAEGKLAKLPAVNGDRILISGNKVG